MGTRLGAIGVLLAATAAWSWNGDYAWHDPAAVTSTAGQKPGAGGIYGTGARSEGGIKCDHCHKPATVTPAIDAQIAFSPALVGGNRYAPGTRYTVTVTLQNEAFKATDAGVLHNNFAGMFEDNLGAVVGRLESDNGQIQGTSCPNPVPTSFTAGSTTLMYRDCHGILGRSTNVNLDRWVFSWTAPATNVGAITFHYGVVDGNGNDRTMARDGGPDDAVKMGSLVLVQ